MDPAVEHGPIVPPQVHCVGRDSHGVEHYGIFQWRRVDDRWQLGTCSLCATPAPPPDTIPASSEEHNE